MTLLPPWLLVRLESAIGVRPRLVPLSEGQVLGILRWWMELREGGARNTHLGMPRGGSTEEAGWLLLVGTIAAKLVRCPGNPMQQAVPWQCSAVEASLYAERAVDDEQIALGQAMTATGMTAGERAMRQSDLDRARGVLRRLRESTAYRTGVESLRWELAAALQDDGAFREAVRRMVGQ